MGTTNGQSVSFPILTTERLVLRKLKPEDADDLYRYFSLDEVTEFLDLDTFQTVEQAGELIRIWNQRFEDGQGIRWGIALKEDDRLIGTCGFHHWMKAHYKAEIGYELSPEYWRKGIMTEAIGGILAFGFRVWGLNRIEAFIDPRNVASRKLLEKLGLKEEGVLRECFFEKNRFVDAVLFAILRKEYMKRGEDRHGRDTV